MRCEQELRRELRVFYGDRVAFMRLSLALLRYAVEAEILEGSTQAEGRSARRFFLPPSDVQDLMLQINEAPVKPKKSRPARGWLSWLLPSPDRRGRV